MLSGDTSLLRFITIALLAAILILPVRAQTNAGQISGTVLDSTQAPVPGCAVTATNVQTGLKHSGITESNGFYSLPGLPAGTYNIKAELPGFKSIEQAGVVLDAASRRTVDFQLEVGEVTDSVSVTASVDQVQTTSGDVSRVITGSQLNQIALNGRNYIQLLTLLPGVVATTSNPFTLGLSTTGQRINGIRSNSIYFLVDGADNLDNGANSNAIITPSLDSISEIKVLTSSYSAEFGGRSGAMVNVVTKSGTRDFSGTLFEFIRNDVFDARSFFASDVDPLRFNDFGWTLGGPVFFGNWNADKSKLFFFAGQEWKYTHAGEVRLSTVPTADERNGDFRNSSLAAPIDPLTGQAFSGRVVPSARFSKNGPLLLKPYPLPNFAGPGGNYRASGVSRTDTREDHIRLDYILSPKTQVMYRLTHDQVDILNAFQGGNTGIVPGGRPRPGWTTILSLTHLFSPTMLNSASFSVTANQIQGLPQNGVLKRQDLGLTYPEMFPVNAYGVGPNLSIAGFTGYTAGDRIRNLNTTFQWRDDFSKVIRSHTFKFGTQITRSRKDQNTIAIDNGNVTFNTSARNSTRNVLADVLLGNFQNYTEGQIDTAWFARFNQFEFYAQDSWKVNRRLNLELGLRYNIIAPLYSALGNFTTFLPSRFDPARAPQVSRQEGSLTPGTGDRLNGIAIFGSGFPDAAKGRIPEANDPSLGRLFVGLPRGGMETSYVDFGPRIGFAYDPTGRGKTAIRGGFGMFFDRVRTDFLGGTAGNPPFSSSANVFDGNIDNPGGGTARAFPPNLSAIAVKQGMPSVMSFNLGIQRELTGDVILDVGYVGSLARHLTRTVNINQLPVGTRLNPPNSTINANALRPFPGYANINLQENGDNSNYNSLQISANRRMQRGLAFGVSYTLSKTLDTSSGTPQDSYLANADYGLSSIHRMHAFNVNYVYELPFFRNDSSILLRSILGGWDLAGVTSFQSGAPNTVTVPADVARIGVASSRATLIANPKLSKNARTLSRWFNTEAFLPSDRMVQGQFGNSGRNILIGPGFSQWDMSLSKNFPFHESILLQFRAEAFNIWNHASFTSLNTTVRFDSAGRPSQSYGAVNGSGPGRVLEFGLRLRF